MALGASYQSEMHRVKNLGLLGPAMTDWCQSRGTLWGQWWKIQLLLTLRWCYTRKLQQQKNYNHNSYKMFSYSFLPFFSSTSFVSLTWRYIYVYTHTHHWFYTDFPEYTYSLHTCSSLKFFYISERQADRMCTAGLPPRCLERQQLSRGSGQGPGLQPPVPTGMAGFQSPVSSGCLPESARGQSQEQPRSWTWALRYGMRCPDILISRSNALL